MSLIASWSPSRLEKYDTCPRKAKYEIVDRLCPRCFKGKVLGGFDTPAICDTCGETIVKGEALERGTDIGNRLDLYLIGKKKVFPVEIRNPQAQAAVKEAKAAVAVGKAQIQLDIILDRNWRLLKKTGNFAPRGYWGWFKLDLLRFIDAKSCKVIDWKTGGIDKNTGAVRAEAKYDDQLNCYSVAALSAFPQMEASTAALVFLDTGPRFDPTVERPQGTVTRGVLAKAQKYWEGRTKAMLSDQVFAPRPNEKCKWCDFSTRKGGPCPN